jgi:hypothetical protein
MRIRIVVFLMAMIFAVVLAVIIGQRLSAQAMTVAVGVVAGVAASIPTSLFMVWVTSRALQDRRAPVEMPRPAPEPRVVMMAPPSGYATAPQYAVNPYAAQMPAGYALQPPPMPRNFQVIGGAEMPVDAQSPAEEDAWPR